MFISHTMFKYIFEQIRLNTKSWSICFSYFLLCILRKITIVKYVYKPYPRIFINKVSLKSNISNPQKVNLNRFSSKSVNWYTYMKNTCNMWLAHTYICIYHICMSKKYVRKGGLIYILLDFLWRCPDNFGRVCTSA